MDQKEITLKDVYLLLRKMNTNLSDRIDKVEEKIQELIQDTQAQVGTLKEKIHSLEEENKNLKIRITKCEKKQKTNNLVFYGVPEEIEGTEEKQKDLLKTLIHLLNTKLQVSVAKGEIDNIFRLGRNAQHTRPILVSFTSKLKKQEILRNASKLKGYKIGISEDLNREELQERKVLLEGLRQAKKNNNKAYIKGNKLIIDGNQYTVEDIENKENAASDYFEPPERKVSSAPTTPSPKEIVFEEAETFTDTTEDHQKSEERRETKEKDPRKPRKPTISSVSDTTKQNINPPRLLRNPRK